MGLQRIEGVVSGHLVQIRKPKQGIISLTTGLPETSWKGVKGMASEVPCFLGASGTPPIERLARLQALQCISAERTQHVIAVQRS